MFTCLKRVRKKPKMDMDKIGQNIIKAFMVLVGIVGVIGGLFLGLFLVALILGVIFGTVLDGSITVDSNTNTTLTQVQGNFSSTVSDITSGAGIAGSLIPVAIVLVVFAGLVYLGYKGYQKYKSKGGNMGGY